MCLPVGRQDASDDLFKSEELDLSRTIEQVYVESLRSETDAYLALIATTLLLPLLVMTSRSNSVIEAERPSLPNFNFCGTDSEDVTEFVRGV